MIEASSDTFPATVVELLATRLATIDPDVEVIKRALRPADPRQSIGVYGQVWAPDQTSLEMHGSGWVEPTMQRYTIGIQAFVKDADEVNGLNVHSKMGHLIRAMLYRDVPLRVGLQALSYTADGITESYKMHGIGNQRFVQNEVGSDWLYLSTLDFWLDTETR